MYLTKLISAVLLVFLAALGCASPDERGSPQTSSPPREIWPAVSGIEGRVLAHLYVTQAGTVTKVEIKESTHEALSRDVIEKARGYRFRPEDQPFIGQLEVEFRRSSK